LALRPTMSIFNYASYYKPIEKKPGTEQFRASLNH
jgi:hypothetical protein